MSVKLFDLTGKVAIVTGASRGLGQHFSRALAKAGADLVITSRKPESLDGFRKEIEGIGRKAHADAVFQLLFRDALRIEAQIIRDIRNPVPFPEFGMPARPAPEGVGAEITGVILEADLHAVDFVIYGDDLGKAAVVVRIAAIRQIAHVIAKLDPVPMT